MAEASEGRSPAMSSEVVWKTDNLGTRTVSYKGWSASKIGDGWRVLGPEDCPHEGGVWVKAEGDKAIVSILRALSGEPDPRVAELEAERDAAIATMEEAVALAEERGKLIEQDRFDSIMDCVELQKTIAARDAEVKMLREALERVGADLRYYDRRDKGPKVNRTPHLTATRDVVLAALSEPARERDGGGG